MSKMSKKSWEGGVRNFASCAELEADFGAGHYFDGLPAQLELEKRLTKMMGQPAITTSRGMTAIASVLWTLTWADDVVICSDDVYPGTRALLGEWEKNQRLRKVVWFNPTDTIDLREKMAFEIQYQPNRRPLVFTETFGNAKQMRVADLPAVLSSCLDYDCYLVVDITFTPLFRPSGAPKLVTVASLTKYGQEGDLLMGGLIAAQTQVIDRIKATRAYQNSRLLPQIAEIYLDEITKAKLQQRYECQSRNTQVLAELCVAHPAVDHVWYPGLREHPQYELVQRDYNGRGGGTLYLQLKDGEVAARQVSDQLAAGKNNWQIAVSFAANDWRILPWIGWLRQHVDCDGLLRISPGRVNPNRNISAFREALDSLK